MELGECRPSNKMTGKNILFQLRVSILVGGSDQERAKKLVEAKQARIRDRINFVIRSAEPTYLNEPGLETIKRRIKHELDRVFDDNEIIREVLIPELLQSGSGL
ncbi:MAG: flagellar basal body-associated FliL family protein [Planctomycetes bacterium]|nr:flagellar basal body-associated FliL family protein [Planctomycetota bacterium]